MSFSFLRHTVALTVMSLAGLSHAAGYGSNLIVNGDAESGMAGWTTYAGVDTFSAEAYGDNWVLPTEPGPVNRGLNLFVGGSGVSYGAAFQDASLSSFAADVSRGGVGYTLSGWLGGWLQQDDNAKISVRFLDTANTLLSTATLGPVTPAQRSGVTGLFFVTMSGTVPAAARTAEFVLEMTRLNGGDNDGYADNLSFSLSAAAVPEPQTYVLMLSGLAAAGLRAARRNRR
jgi:hypothetical protein